MLQHQTEGVKESRGPQPACACNKPLSRCDYPHCSRKIDFRPSGDGLGTAPHRREGRRTATILSHVWERAIRYFGLTEEDLADALEIEQAKAAGRAEDKALMQAELDAGSAAYLMGMTYDDPMLTKVGRQGWLAAERNWRNGYRCGYDGVLDVPADYPSRSLRKGWEAGRDAKKLESMVSL